MSKNHKVEIILSFKLLAFRPVIHGQNILPILRSNQLDVTSHIYLIMTYLIYTMTSLKSQRHEISAIFDIIIWMLKGYYFGDYISLYLFSYEEH